MKSIEVGRLGPKVSTTHEWWIATGCRGNFKQWTHIMRSDDMGPTCHSTRLLSMVLSGAFDLRCVHSEPWGNHWVCEWYIIYIRALKHVSELLETRRFRSRVVVQSADTPLPCLLPAQSRTKKKFKNGYLISVRNNIITEKPFTVAMYTCVGLVFKSISILFRSSRSGGVT